MPRFARLEYPGAIYHVINRGNYRSDVFATPNTAQAFVGVLEEAVVRFEWELGAYVVMRNHFHLALRTPQPNLSAGMHWLQATFATRFNRFRGERGHLFQGRYKALVLQDEKVWAEVVNYVHLNPLRAHIVEPDQLDSFRWSSLDRFAQNKRCEGLKSSGWMPTLGFDDSEPGWNDYVDYLLNIHAAEQRKPVAERESFSKGWAIGADDWIQTLKQEAVRQHESPAKAEYHEAKDAQRLRWEARLAELLQERGRTEADLKLSGRAGRWKVALADQLQREMGVPIVWLAETLHLGKPSALRTRLWAFRKS